MDHDNGDRRIVLIFGLIAILYFIYQYHQRIEKEVPIVKSPQPTKIKQTKKQTKKQIKQVSLVDELSELSSIGNESEGGYSLDSLVEDKESIFDSQITAKF